MRRLDPRSDLALLGPSHEVIDEHTEPAHGPGLKLGDYRGQVVDAAQVLHDDAGIAQVVAPDLLHQLGIVAALDVDAARPGDLGPAGRGRDRTGPGPPARRPPPAGRPRPP